MDLEAASAGNDLREPVVTYLKIYSVLSQRSIARRLGISRILVSRLRLGGVAKLKLRLQECVRC